MSFPIKTSSICRAIAASLLLVAGTDAKADGSAVSVTLGGFLAAESVYRTRSEQADIGSAYGAVPYRNASAAHMSELRMTARQSRLSLLVQGKADSDIALAFYGEFDFLGGAQTANSNESNSYNPRLRNFYATVDWQSLGLQLLAGQSWSLATLNGKGIAPRSELPPATIDAQYAVGFNWARQPQIRITKTWNREIWLAVSVENAQTTFAPNAAAAPGIAVVNATAGTSGFDKANNFSLNHLPDFVGKLAWEPVIDGAQPLHVEFLALGRSFYDRINASGNNAVGAAPGIGNATVWGGGFGGSVVWQAIPQWLDLQVTTLHGQGVGRYGTGQLPDVTVRPGGALAPLTETTGLIGATLHLTPGIDIYGYAGREMQSAKYFDVAGGHYGLGNPAYNLAGCFTEGGACSANLKSLNQVNAGLWWRPYQAGSSSFRFGLQYSHTQLTAFSDAGGTPGTADDMLFTSLRYYPF